MAKTLTQNDEELRKILHNIEAVRNEVSQGNSASGL